MTWKPVLRWKRYENLTKPARVIWWIVFIGSIMLGAWTYSRFSLEGRYVRGFASFVVVAWAVQFAALELLLLIGLRETRNGT